MKRSIQNSEITIATVLGKSEFWQLLDAGPEGFEGGLTTRKYVGMTKCSRATAFREITDLVEKGILKQNEGAGRSVSYGPFWGRNT